MIQRAIYGVGILLLFLCFPLVRAQEPVEYAEATVTANTPDLTVQIHSGSKAGQKAVIDTSFVANFAGDTFAPGDRVIVSITKVQGTEQVLISDYDRRQPLLLLAGLFVAVVVAVTRMKGIASFVGMGFSFYIIMNIVIPQIIQGVNPVFITVMATGIMIPVMFYLAHGFNKKSTIAMVGTLAALFVTGSLAFLFVSLTHLTGFASEEAVFIQSFHGSADMIRNLLLAGIIIGTLGVLDDITISQTAIVEKLAEANPRYSIRQLFTRSMDVGRDHIASLVNTLILVYAGASLPLFVLFKDQNVPLLPVINHEIIATEVVRTLVSSIGLVMAVPFTTLIAAIYMKNSR